MNAFAQFLPNLIVVAGVADALHLIHRYSSNWAPENDQPAAAAEAVISKRSAIAFTTLTSAAGFASFALGGFAPFAIVGIFGAFAVIAAMAISLLLAPALLPTLASTTPRPIANRLGHLADRTAQWSAKHAVPVALATAVVCLASVIGVVRTEVSFDGGAIVGDAGGADEFQRASELLDGAVPFQILYSNAEGVLTPAALERAEQITALATETTIGGTPVRAEPDIHATIEIVSDILNRINPTDQQLTPSQATEVARSEQSKAVATLISADNTALRLPFVSGFVAQTDSSRDTRSLQDSLDELATEGERIIVTGSAVASGRSADTALPSVVRSYGIALVAIAILVALVVRGRQRAFIAMVPNILPAFLLLGFLGIVGVPVDLVLIQMAAIVIGISVDDTIHVVHDSYLDPNRSASLTTNLTNSMRNTGPALILTSTLIATGLLAMVFLPFPAYARIGPIGGVAVLLALAADLIVLPALMSLLDDLETET